MNVRASLIVFAGRGLALAPTLNHPGGTIRGGGYDPDTNVVYLGGGVGHPRGVAAAGGDPSKGNIAGITVFERDDGTVFWSNDSLSLNQCLTAQAARQVQLGLQLAYPGCAVYPIGRISDVPRSGPS